MIPVRTLAASLALAASAVAAHAGAAECKLDPRAAPAKAQLFKGVVRGPASAAEVSEQTRIAVQRTRAPESPAYEKYPRIFAYFVANGVRHGTIAAVTDSAMPKAGDKVILASRHRDPTLPCAFAPWTVVRDKTAKPVS